MKIVNNIALILNIIGGINWGLIGLFKFDLVAWICGGQDSVFARIIYCIVGLAAIWCISLLFNGRDRRKRLIGSNRLLHHFGFNLIKYLFFKTADI